MAYHILVHKGWSEKIIFKHISRGQAISSSDKDNVNVSIVR